MYQDMSTTRTHYTIMSRTPHDNTRTNRLSLSHHELLYARDVVTYNSAVASAWWGEARLDGQHCQAVQEVVTLLDMEKSHCKLVCQATFPMYS